MSKKKMQKADPRVIKTSKPEKILYPLICRSKENPPLVYWPMCSHMCKNCNIMGVDSKEVSDTSNFILDFWIKCIILEQLGYKFCDLSNELQFEVHKYIGGSLCYVSLAELLEGTQKILNK